MLKSFEIDMVGASGSQAEALQNRVSGCISAGVIRKPLALA